MKIVIKAYPQGFLLRKNVGHWRVVGTPRPVRKD